MPFPTDMTQIASIASDVLLALGAIGAGAYCMILARRLKRFNNLENGVGGAVAVLSAQVDDMTKTLDRARKAAAHSSASLTALTERAEDSARKRELMMASLHDLPESASDEERHDAEWIETETESPVGEPEVPLFSSKRRTTETAA